MSKYEQNRGVRVFHTIVSIALLLAGGALIGVGIWLKVTDNAGPVDLQYSGSNFFKLVLNIGIGAIIAGAFLVLASIAALISLSRKCVGITFRVIYVLMALVILAVLIFITVVSSLIVHNEDNADVREFVEDAWETTVISNPQAVCNIESNLRCRGFSNSDCTGCPTGSEDDCDDADDDRCAVCPSDNEFTIGCYTRIQRDMRRIFLPTAIIAALLAAIVLVDVLTICCL